MKLYSYFRSSASYRVRIAPYFKGLSYQYVPVHLVRNGGEQLMPAYRKINQDALVPALVDGSDVLLQSLAIIEYLEETHPEPPLPPRDPLARAYVRSIALQIACEIHPLDNPRVLKYLKNEMGVSDEAKTAWYRHGVEAGSSTLEERLAGDTRTGRFCYRDNPTVADLFLIPQVFNAQRFEIDTRQYPTIQRIYDAALKLEAFMRASPGSQPDAE
ncbi:TPA: maleylacetoacetate isomerase [Burkholderia vietnamiensis]|uniref:maleylacetoacetate isomerase n=1 Tax=Burkholderia vietnamiensis TaxID=60552 RepID=UPI001BA140C3|nr:maleylacetoacetate isomerase [Burkholderia vietnamiensis]MBR7911637.1 maleylacetoacetate isomerase [Burkholderia vietnamiensis]HDR9274051.1 maleylacetoacetate isomerase [Burkholderia vietnamiensis]